MSGYWGRVSAALRLEDGWETILHITSYDFFGDSLACSRSDIERSGS